MTMRGTRRALCVLSLLATHATPVRSQSLADRIAAVKNGFVGFHFAARPGICGDGQQFIRMGRSYIGSNFGNTRDLTCVPGPVQVRLAMRDGVVERLEFWVGPLRERDGQSLGPISTAEAARFLMDVAARASGSPSARAILPAVLADSAIIWPALVTIARDTDTRSQATLQEAMMWLSRFAAGALVGRPADPTVGEDDDDDRSKGGLKTHAVFVLSQLRNREGVPALLDIARSNPDRHVRSQALFWLGQSGDPRALDLFESILKS